MGRERIATQTHEDEMRVKAGRNEQRGRKVNLRGQFIAVRNQVARSATEGTTGMEKEKGEKMQAKIM